MCDENVEIGLRSVLILERGGGSFEGSCVAELRRFD
jgi:hypothetical protein